ncbi:MAG: flavodoxin domain-containing protein [Candidatus Bathyarchaeia archaeon]
MNEGDKILIAYATKSGTTEEYANAIASVLRDEFKMQVDLVDLRKDRNPDLTQYRNIIIGSGVRMGKIYGEAVNFMQNNFGDRKVAIFLSALDSKEHAINEYVNKILEKNKALKPFSIEVFGGRIRILGKTVQDKRDIVKARAWAHDIARQIIT